MSLIVHAPNVHRGGGKTLLLGILQALNRYPHSRALVDQRLETPDLPSGLEIIRFPPTIAGRLRAERRLQLEAGPADVVLCLGNLPPLLRLRAQRTVLFLQNRYLIDPMDTSTFGPGVRLRIAIERLWLRQRLHHAQQTIVQSPSMAETAQHCLGIKPAVMPFAVIAPDLTTRVTSTGSGVAREGFLYVASGEPHKNHRRLLEAWALLAAEGIRPLLRLTLNPGHHRELCDWIDTYSARHDLRVENSGEVDSGQLSQMYGAAAALIYPSCAESLGLPLLEARAGGLPILASERDYVRDIVVPQQSFDPESALSIARAVRRFLDKAAPVLNISTPEHFLDLVQRG